MEHPSVATLDGKANRQVKVPKWVGVGPRIVVALKLWVGGWVTQAPNDGPSCLPKGPIRFYDE